MSKKIKNVVIASLFGLAIIVSYMMGTKSSNLMTIGNQNETVSIGNKEIKDMLNLKGDLDYKKIIKNIDELEKIINTYYLNKYSKKDLEEGIYKGIMESLKDPYSVYYDAKEFKALNEQTTGAFGGVGIQVSPTEDNYIEVISPLKDTPADKAGIRSGDIIMQINNQTYTGSQLEDAVKVMRGNPGEEVKLTILRGKGASRKTLEFVVKREIIKMESVHAKMINDNIGYILLTGFQDETDEDFKSAIKDLKEKGAKKFILDLRNNPGGLLDVALSIADELMDKATVISVKDKNGNKEDYKTEDGSEKFELVTLINEGSASASEVLSAALKENGRSKIVGAKSYGKGIIQQIYPVNNINPGDGLKITIAEFFTPNGNKIHGAGISPDYEVKIPESVTNIGVEHLQDDTQLKKAIELLK
ncbi:C-terminal processing peptidase [Helcococcus kunzii ATCC 51366]|uniref:C-terminal processing peptidase n=1 Tax=Helcococcus kunzii ATCC 51366 TaxID=883114 RepID=H3NM41_9FIRM|nr:S41 family peptidase [Helcococcus kunzii]EHR35450.1 C-terminal processing peptidase [Helcococcus kunzii ATCC 51366]